MTVINLASPSADLGTYPASSAYNVSHTAVRMQAMGVSARYTLLEVDQVLSDFFALTEAH